MSSRAVATLAAVGALAAAGCGGAAEEPSAARTSASVSASASLSPSATATVSTTPTPTPSPKSSRLKIGQTYKDDYISVTVQKVVLNGKKQYGGTYSGAIVKTCVIDLGEYDFLAFSWSPWAMIDTDAGRYPDLGESGGGLPSPVFPNGEQDGTFYPGDCTKGWIFFDVPKGTKVAAVRYQSADMTKPTEWAVK